jgi:hypothetical protein
MNTKDTQLNRRTTLPHFQYRIALDLGSESMAAYCQESQPRGVMIPLQEHAEALTKARDLDLLKEGNKLSPRLKTLITMETNRQPLSLPDDHATLDLLAGDNYSTRCLFGYFHSNTPNSPYVLPNPKVPFQWGCGSIIPAVPSTAGENAQYNPLQLVQHITTQVIRNFVLKSSVLRHAAPRQIHLTLTVPNVYSLSHVEEIRRYVEAQTELGAVDVLYESDAIAYSLLVAKDAAADPKELQEIKDEIRTRKLRYKRLRMLTVDVGRGTTDMSVVEVREPPTPSDKGQHWVYGRTGSCDAGNQLSYYFVEFYDRLMRYVFQKHKYTEAHFTFLSLKDPSLITAQRNVNRLLENHIELIKKSVRLKRSRKLVLEGLDSAEQLSQLDRILDQYFQYIHGNNWKIDNDLKRRMEPVLADLRKAMTLPKKFLGDFQQTLLKPRSSIRGWRKGRPLNWLLRKLLGSDADELEKKDALNELVGKILTYTEDRVCGLVEYLRTMVEEHRVAGAKGNAFESSYSFAVIAGQGAQFDPLRRGLRRAIMRLGIPDHQIYQLTRKEAKEACCQGAVQYQLLGYEHMNPNMLFGSYGFLSAGNEPYIPLDVLKLRTGELVEVNFPNDGMYQLIYSTRAILKDQEPVFSDGYTALVKQVFPGEYPARTTSIRYSLAQRALYLGNEEIRVLPNFGSVPAAIYPKVWPEISPVDDKVIS